MTTLVLFGTISAKRKLDTRGKYDAMAFDLEIEDMQTWACAAFGRSAGQVKRLQEGSWVRITGEVADLNLERRVNGIKVSEALAMKAPQATQIDGEIVDIQLGTAGRRGWIEFVDADGISWALEGQNGRLAEAVGGLKAGAKVSASFLNLPILARFQGDMQPVMSSILNNLRHKELAAA